MERPRRGRAPGRQCDAAGRRPGRSPAGRPRDGGRQRGAAAPRPGRGTPAGRRRWPWPSWRPPPRPPTWPRPSGARSGSTSRSTGGEESTARFALLVRAFEAWTHADDVRRAIGDAESPPPPASLLTMVHAACGFVPNLLAARGATRAAWSGCGSPTYRGGLGRRPGCRGRRAAGRRRPVEAEVVTEAVGFCRAMSAGCRPPSCCARSPAVTAGRGRRRGPALAVL